MNWLWSQVFQGSVKNVFAVSVPSLTLAGTVADYLSPDATTQYSWETETIP